MWVYKTYLHIKKDKGWTMQHVIGELERYAKQDVLKPEDIRHIYKLSLYCSAEHQLSVNNYIQSISLNSQSSSAKLDFKEYIKLICYNVSLLFTKDIKKYQKGNDFNFILTNLIKILVAQLNSKFNGVQSLSTLIAHIFKENSGKSNSFMTIIDIVNHLNAIRVNYPENYESDSFFFFKDYYFKKLAEDDGADDSLIQRGGRILIVLCDVVRRHHIYDNKLLHTKLNSIQIECEEVVSSIKENTGEFLNIFQKMNSESEEFPQQYDRVEVSLIILHNLIHIYMLLFKENILNEVTLFDIRAESVKEKNGKEEKADIENGWEDSDEESNRGEDFNENSLGMLGIYEKKPTVFAFGYVKSLLTNYLESKQQDYIYSQQKKEGEKIYYPVQIIEEIKKKSNCLFAKNSRHYCFTIEGFNDTEAKNLFDKFLYFTRLASYNVYDAFTLTLDEKYGNKVDTLASTLNTVVGILNYYDPKKSNCLADKEKLNSEKWQFTFNDLEIFIIASAPCYPKTHSRYSFDIKSTVILFQPMITFANHTIPKSDQTANIRSEIRNNFFKAKRPYDNFAVMKSPIDAHRYVKPLNPEDEPISWWEAKRFFEPSTSLERLLTQLYSS